jgi:hypothetical protein
MKVHKIINRFSHLVYGKEKKRTSQSCLIVATRLAPNAYKKRKTKNLKENINLKTRTRAVAAAEHMYAYSIYNFKIYIYISLSLFFFSPFLSALQQGERESR